MSEVPENERGAAVKVRENCFAVERRVPRDSENRTHVVRLFVFRECWLEAVALYEVLSSRVRFVLERVLSDFDLTHVSLIPFFVFWFLGLGFRLLAFASLFMR